jgi:ubiquinone/menaquinone biosynthesis C-methylase UbiE
MSNRHWLAFACRLIRLAGRPSEATSNLIRSSYDRIAGGYDEAWTDHMRSLSLELLDRLAPPPGARCLDLTCGTGFVTAELARRCGTRPIGVDASAGMLDVARRQNAACDFVAGDALEFLREQPAGSADIVACGWGLGYTRPWKVLGQMARVLRPGGRVAIIDNSLFSLWRVIWCATRTFAERPEALDHVMKVRFLPGSGTLAWLMRGRGLRVMHTADGSKSYAVGSGQEAIARLTATGAAAGFEFAARADLKDDIFSRFARNLERDARGPAGIAITHRYLAAIGPKR